MREIKADYEEGSVESLKMHDGSIIQLHKLAEDWNPLDRVSAMNAVQKAKSKNEILTGLLYLNTDSEDLHELLQTSRPTAEYINQIRALPRLGGSRNNQRRI